MKIKPELFNIEWILLLSLISITPIKADEWSVDGSVYQDFSYDDNIRMIEKNPDASAIYKITPTLVFARRTENTEISANASYGIERFSDTTQFDRDIQNYGISGLYQTERMVSKINALYSVIPLRDNAESDIGNFGSTAEATTRSISPSISYQLTELDNFNISASVSDTKFDSGESNNFSDRENKDINFTWSRQWTQRYSAGLSLFYSNFKSSNDSQFSDVSSTINTAGLNFFSTYLISEKWKFDGQIGIRNTESETEFKSIFGKNRQTSTSNGFLMDTVLSYNGENILGDIRFNRELVPSSSGSLNEQSRFSSQITYRITSRLSTNMFISYQLSESASNSSSTERTNFTVMPRVSWKITPEWAVTARYRYRNQEVSGGTTSRTANSNLFTISLNYNWQGLSLAR